MDSGWHEDPLAGPGTERYHDGERWTDRVRSVEVSAAAAEGEPETPPLPDAVDDGNTDRADGGSPRLTLAAVVVGVSLLVAIVVASSITARRSDIESLTIDEPAVGASYTDPEGARATSSRSPSSSAAAPRGLAADAGRSVGHRR